jgi:hypothetical protein
MQIINWEIAKHPMNWVTVLLMVFIAGIFIHLVMDFYGAKPATGKNQ